MQHTKWVSCWGCGTSITNQKEARFAKDLTLRYPFFICFDGSGLRFRFSNYTGTQPVTLQASVARQLTVADAPQAKNTEPTESYDVGKISPASYDTGASRPKWFDKNSLIDSATAVDITKNGARQITINPGEEVESDEISFSVTAGETLTVSLYLEDYTDMNSGVLVTGPLSKGYYSYGNFEKESQLPRDLTRNTNWYYFLNTIDVLTEEKNHALVCFGDSITAQSWPDYLALRAWNEGYRDISVIRRAVSGTRILRQYDCITYAAYGLKGETRFPLEINTAGASAVIIQHGINDIIHPVGEEVNRFRPMSDLPTLQQLKDGVENIYIQPAKRLGLKVYGGTLLPVFGWRTYRDFREQLKSQFNQWLLTTASLDGCIDFDKALQDDANPAAFKKEYDSGDHLHPSEDGYAKMAQIIPAEILK